MTVFEGAFRKWAFSGGGAVKYGFYFSKDLIFAALIFTPQRSSKSRALKVFEKWLLPGCLLFGLGAAISSLYDFNLVGALLTARAAVVLPLMVLAAVPRLAGLPIRWVLWLLLVCTVLNFALGVEQNRLPPGHFLNRYAAEDANVGAEMSGVRATGTFAYITGMGVISGVGIWAGLALMSIARTPKERIAAWVVLGSGFGCGLASISRGPIVIGGAMVAAWLAGSIRGITALARNLVVGACCVAIAVTLGLDATFSNLGEGLLQRSAKATDNISGRTFGQIEELVQAIGECPLGDGFGTEQAAGQFYATGKTRFKDYESPLPRLVMETGLLGFLGYLVVCAGAVISLQAAKRRATREMRALLLATQVFLLPIFYGGVIYNHTASAFTWLMFAAVLAARELEDGGAPAKTSSFSRT